MAKITRLDDPNNPYNVKKTPTSAPTAEQQARNRAASEALRRRDENAALNARPAPAEKRSVSPYMEARHRAIENAERWAMGQALRGK